jgi:hypothetical protein
VLAYKCIVSREDLQYQARTTASARATRYPAFSQGYGFTLLGVAMKFFIVMCSGSSASMPSALSPSP